MKAFFAKCSRDIGISLIPYGLIPNPSCGSRLFHMMPVQNVVSV